MPENVKLDMAALEDACLSSPEVRQKCFAVAGQIVEKYQALEPGSIGQSAEAQYAAKDGARVVVKSPLAHIYEFGAPGHRYYGRGVAPLAARGSLRNAAEAVAGRPPVDRGGAQ